jgi:hypothetical protein
MASWRDYHRIVLVLGTILLAIVCVYLQLPGGNPPLAELKHCKPNNDVFSIL